IRPYQPHRVPEVIDAVQKRSASTSLLYDLLVGESALVNELLHMGGFGGKTRREQARISTRLFKTWDFHLRRMCTGYDFRSLGPELFEIATNTLVAQRSAAREPKPAGSQHAEDGEELLYEPDGGESFGGLGIVEVCDSDLLTAIDERHAIGRIHEFERLP